MACHLFRLFPIAHNRSVRMTSDMPIDECYAKAIATYKGALEMWYLWMVVAMVGIVIVVALIALNVLHVILGWRFDEDWDKMSQDGRWKLQNEARKKNM